MRILRIISGLKTRRTTEVELLFWRLSMSDIGDFDSSPGSNNRKRNPPTVIVCRFVQPVAANDLSALTNFFRFFVQINGFYSDWFPTQLLNGFVGRPSVSS